MSGKFTITVHIDKAIQNRRFNSRYYAVIHATIFNYNQSTLSDPSQGAQRLTAHYRDLTLSCEITSGTSEQ